MKIDQLTQIVIGAAYKVHNTLGFGFREKVYQRAMLVELERQGLSTIEEYPMTVYYEGVKIGTHRADLLVDKRLIVELKAILETSKADEIQLVNYLTATGIDIGLLINFGQSVSVKRKYRKYKNTKNSE